MSLMSTLEAAAGTRSKTILDHCRAPGTLKERRFFTDEEASAFVFICPLCGNDFGLFELFSKHNTSEHENKIVELEKFRYPIGAV